ncbi:MAG: hypothetical protein SOZ50_06390, partial [Sodaliphilus sp.]|nr:hypothetical protein [Sodaliphilus sp.]
MILKVGAFTSKPVIVIYKCKNSPTPKAILKESIQNMHEKISTKVGQIYNKTKDFLTFFSICS